MITFVKKIVYETNSCLYIEFGFINKSDWFQVLNSGIVISRFENKSYNIRRLLDYEAFSAWYQKAYDLESIYEMSLTYWEEYDIYS